MKNSIHWLIVFLPLGLHAQLFYRLVPLETPGGPQTQASYPHGLNDQGQVAGDFWAPEQAFLGMFFYDDSNGMVGLVGQGGWLSYSTGLNNAGQIAVYGPTASNTAFQAFRCSPAAGCMPLGNLGGRETETGGINNHGQVTGFSERADGYEHAFRYSDGIGMEDLGSLYGGHSCGYAINDLGWVTGSSDVYSAFLYRDDVGMIDLGPGRGYGINSQGVVVGEGGWAEGPVMFRDGQVISLGDVAGEARGINNHNEVVGTTSSFRAFLWTEKTGMVDLNTLVDTNGGWIVATGVAINDAGQITGSGFLNSKNIAIRLDPIPPKLQISPQGTNMLLSWTPPWPDAVLETSASTSSTNWQAIPNGGTNVVSVPWSGTNQFFRVVRRPGSGSP
jgi:probable HAF family extracellular repeat protein